MDHHAYAETSDDHEVIHDLLNWMCRAANYEKRALPVVKQNLATHISRNSGDQRFMDHLTRLRSRIRQVRLTANQDHPVGLVSSVWKDASILEAFWMTVQEVCPEDLMQCLATKVELETLRHHTTQSVPRAVYPSETTNEHLDVGKTLGASEHDPGLSSDEQRNDSRDIPSNSTLTVRSVASESRALIVRPSYTMIRTQKPSSRQLMVQHCGFNGSASVPLLGSAGALVGCCEHCGRMPCEERYWLLRYECKERTSIQSFAQAFDAVCARSGLQIRRYVVTEPALSSRTKYVYVDVAGEPTELGKALPVALYQPRVMVPSSFRMQSCAEAIAAIVPELRKIKLLDGAGSRHVIEN